MPKDPFPEKVSEDLQENKVTKEIKDQLERKELLESPDLKDLPVFLDSSDLLVLMVPKVSIFTFYSRNIEITIFLDTSLILQSLQVAKVKPENPEPMLNIVLAHPEVELTTDSREELATEVAEDLPATRATVVVVPFNFVLLLENAIFINSKINCRIVNYRNKCVPDH